jgi:hypothetical protein
LVIWCGATNAYGSNFLGINAGYNAINAYNSNFALVMLQQVQVVRISFGSASKEQQMLIVLSLVITLVLTQQVRSFKFLGLNSGYKEKFQISGQSAGYKQALVTQISWVKMLVFKRQTLVIQH